MSDQPKFLDQRTRIISGLFDVARRSKTKGNTPFLKDFAFHALALAAELKTLSNNSIVNILRGISKLLLK
ncbi:MAG: hypothetical protein UR42_C0001G0018 [Candidatus Roizmanbacteria bacterium GW2011_GWA2_33_33]|uniref:Uncharacterized protein n=2 Tax=Candidatus Roizmaniibacteriota TaxID=1752723 RepID=A0A0G0DAP3_9BACT|nr:MAG: hypothetical protein UR42_C0001G0018 [Candidatus Roizmanbacteria bacterium GW2011_GWA2_33_33]KKP60470.1 MAG: hypothetical protein UR56_C0023G0010 [Candidatus Roizmanbacteria bacterium GW2011_GWC2_34_23]